jgi:twinkle protein
LLSVIDPRLPERLEAVLNTLTPVEELSTADYKDLLRNLRLYQRDFEPVDFARLGARVNPSAGLSELVFPVRYVDGRLIGLRTLRLGHDGRLFESSDPDRSSQESAAGLLPFPLGLHRGLSIPATSCILVGSVLDAVVLQARLSRDAACSHHAVVVLPDPSTLPPVHIPFLDSFETVYLWLANDVQGAQNAHCFARKIDEKRCRVVTSEFPSAFQCVRKKIDLAEVLKESRLCYHEFLTTFDKLRDSVYLEFLQSEALLGVKWQRFEPLNTTLGGFRRGELTVFSGRTGSGKTTFLSEYSLDLCAQGVNTLWCSFEVKNSRLLKMMMKQFSLVNLDEDLDQFERVADQFARLPLYLTDFHGSQRVERVQEAMSHAVYVHDISHVVVDNMQFMLGTTGGSGGGGSMDRFAVQDRVVEMFR